MARVCLFLAPRGGALRGDRHSRARSFPSSNAVVNLSPERDTCLPPMKQDQRIHPVPAEPARRLLFECIQQAPKVIPEELPMDQRPEEVGSDAAPDANLASAQG